MKVFVNGHEFKNWKILDGHLYVKCGFGYSLASALVESGYLVEVKDFNIMKEENKITNNE